MKIHTKAVHAGDRKPAPVEIPVSTPIHTAASFITPTTADQDRVFGGEQKGFAYQRYTNPTNEALEAQIAAMENGHGALACASGMAALQLALQTALLERPRTLLAARDIYGATIKLVHDIMGPWGLQTVWVDTNDLQAVERACQEHQPGALLIETISNPLLRVSATDGLAAICRRHKAALLVDNTFATPLLERPLELGANMVIHSTTKYLNGHGDVLGGIIISDEQHFETLRRLSRVAGPVMGPFEAYLTMRGAKTFPLRMERHCENATRLAAWLSEHEAVEQVFFPGRHDHPDREIVERLLPERMYGGMVSFEIRGARKAQIFAFLDRLRMVVCATSLGDVHTMALYPWISSHRDVPPAHKAEMGVRENLVRVSTGIEDIGDIIADFAQALA